MATHSSVPAWRIPGTGEPGGLPSMGPQSRTWLKWLSSIPLYIPFKNLQFPHLVLITWSFTKLRGPPHPNSLACFTLSRCHSPVNSLTSHGINLICSGICRSHYIEGSLQVLCCLPFLTSWPIQFPLIIQIQLIIYHLLPSPPLVRLDSSGICSENVMYFFFSVSIILCNHVFRFLVTLILWLM